MCESMERMCLFISNGLWVPKNAKLKPQQHPDRWFFSETTWSGQERLDRRSGVHDPDALNMGLCKRLIRTYAALYSKATLEAKNNDQRSRTPNC